MGTTGRWLAAALFAFSAASAAAEDAAGSLAHCPRRAVHHQRLKCPDGLSACDLDDQCDGTCVLAWCVDVVAACRPPRLRLCRIGERPAATVLARAGTKVKGEWPVADDVSTRYAVRCAPARGCRSDPTGCVISLAGAQTDQATCQLGVLYDPGFTSTLVLTRTNGDGAFVYLGAPLDVGTFSSSMPPAATMVLGTIVPGAIAPGFAANASVGGSVTLKVTGVTPSTSIFHRVHGTLDATLVAVDATGMPVPGGAPLQVHAAF